MGEGAVKKIVEYISYFNEVFAVHEDGSESFIASCENNKHARETTNKLNDKLATE